MHLIWSDECSMVLGRKCRRRRYIRKKGDALKKRHYNGTIKSEKITIIVWAYFSSAKLSPLIICDTGSVNADWYFKILENGAMKFIDKLLMPSEDLIPLKLLASMHIYLCMTMLHVIQLRKSQIIWNNHVFKWWNGQLNRRTWIQLEIFGQCSKKLFTSD